jgi:hypothetical protein
MVISADYSTHSSTDYSKHFSSAMRNGLRTDKSEIVQLSATSESLDSLRSELLDCLLHTSISKDVFRRRNNNRSKGLSSTFE